jgi:hypothetical protein
MLPDWPRHSFGGGHGQGADQGGAGVLRLDHGVDVAVLCVGRKAEQALGGMCGIVFSMRSRIHPRSQPEPMLPEDDPAPRMDLLEGDLLANAREIEKRFQLQVRREIAAHLAAGHPIYFGGKADQAGKLFMRTPDGDVHEIVATEFDHNNGARGTAAR